jgi:predicted aldo/keto reductase-like oxidoreductase
MADGRIGHLGFSFHDDLDTFKQVVDGYDNWTMCQIQYNFMDIEHQAGTEGLQYAAAKGLAVVVMEPLRGGRLGTAPEAVAKVWATAPKQRSAAEWALLWVLNQPESTLALSGMSTMDQVVENLEVAGRSGVGLLTDEEMALFDRAREAYHGLSPIPCTSCGYCLPCPSGVAIPRVFQIYNESAMYDDARTGRFRYRGPGGLKEEERADQCTKCGECLEACPQEIDIPEWMKTVHELLGPRDDAPR